jgi:phosphomevalonate kinase
VTRIASAPGKLVLAGEYAVLWGAPAVCMAVDRRAQVTVGPLTDGECRVTTPGFNGADRFRIIDAVTRGIRPPRNIELDTSAFMSGDRKTGIGSSAALTVALLAALESKVDVFAEAVDAHRRLQRGAGSGIDVAAAVHGGLLEYEMPTRAVRRLAWPEGLAFRVIWTGVPASTESQLARLARSASRPSRSALLLAAPRIRDAWRSGDADGILSEYVSYIGVLRQFSVDHDLGIFDAGHDQLTDAAMVDGLVYKPAGAGGGDVGTLFGRCDADLDAFVECHADCIGGVLPCRLDAQGVRLETR